MTMDPERYGSVERAIAYALLPLVPLLILIAYCYFLDPHQGHHNWTCKSYHFVVAECPVPGFDEYVYPCDIAVCDEWDAIDADLTR